MLYFLSETKITISLPFVNADYEADKYSYSLAVQVENWC